MKSSTLHTYQQFHHTSTTDTYSQIRPYLHQWGQQSLAYSAIQPSLKHFEIPNIGLISYRNSTGYTVALGNPLCSPDDRAFLLQQFIAQYPHVLFSQVDGPTVDALRSLNFYCTPMGMDAFIDIHHFTLQGKAKRDLRHYRNRCNAAEVQIREVKDTPANRFEMQQLSKCWLRSKKVPSRKLSFLIRPLSPIPEQDTRIFIAEKGSQAIGFVVFDPMYNRGSISGYTASILRALPASPEGCLDTITLNAIERFKREGLQTLSLGVMPMYKMKETAQQFGKGSSPLYHLCRALYASPWQALSNLPGLSFHKSRYRPTVKPVFVATASPIGLGSMSALTRCCGLLP